MQYICWKVEGKLERHEMMSCLCNIVKVKDVFISIAPALLTFYICRCIIFIVFFFFFLYIFIVLACMYDAYALFSMDIPTTLLNKSSLLHFSCSPNPTSPSNL